MVREIRHDMTDTPPAGRLELQRRIEEKYIAYGDADGADKPARYGVDVLGPSLEIADDLDIPVPVVSGDKVMAQFITLRKGKHRVIEQPDGTRLIGYTKLPEEDEIARGLAEDEAGGGARIQFTLVPYEIDVRGTKTNVSADAVVLGYAVRDAREAGSGADLGRIMGLFYSADVDGSAVSMGDLLELDNGEYAFADVIMRGIGNVKHMTSTLSKTTASATNSNLNGGFYDDGGRPIRVSGDNESEITTMLALSYDDGISNVTRPLNEFDRVVHDGMATLWANGHRVFTIKQLTELIKGRKVTKRSECAPVEESVMKQWHTHAHMDFSDEMRGRTVPTDDGEAVADDGSEIEMSVVNVAKVKVPTTNGGKCEAYVMIAPPIFYQHDRAVGQITTYPRSLLEADTGISATKDTMVLQNAIIRRIARMKHKGAKSPRASDRRIRFVTLMKECGFVAYEEGASNSDINVNKTEAKRVRDKTEKILNSLKDEGYIKDWSFYKEGRYYVGVEIVL